MDWLKKTPIVSLLFAVALAAVPVLLPAEFGAARVGPDDAQALARSYLVRNPRLEVDPLGELILDPVWLEETRAAAAQTRGSADVQLPPRMLARSQARLDELIEAAYAERLRADPAWRNRRAGARTA